nr:hypothetical protein [Tanacetum cinerariifolium]
MVCTNSLLNRTMATMIEQQVALDEALIPSTKRLNVAAKGKQPARATTPTDPSEVERTKAEQLKIVLRKSRQETHISQHGGSSTDEGTGSKPGVPDV